MRITLGIIFAPALLLLLLPAGAQADRRSFVRAYEYATQPEGNLELEIWNELVAPRSGVSDSIITNRIELEYGLTDHWDAALYHVFQQGPDAGFHLDSWRLESRYRLAEKGEWPVDLMLYLEGERPAALGEPFELEEKLIVARDFGRVGLVANLVAEEKLLRGDLGRRYEVDLGARYEIAAALRVAAEVWTIQEVKPGQTVGSYFAGPSLSVATQRFWLQLGFGLGLGSTPDRMQLRSVIGFNL